MAYGWLSFVFRNETNRARAHCGVALPAGDVPVFDILFFVCVDESEHWQFHCSRLEAGNWLCYNRNNKLYFELNEMYEIRKIHSDEVNEALALAWEVFMEFEAPDYKQEGIDTFRHDIVENDAFILKCRQGICPIYAAFDKSRIVGIVGMRADKTHINLVFTKKQYHRQGVATAIFQYLLADLVRENPSLNEITLNSSPYAIPFYLHIGFIPQSEEQEIDGIRFTPMKYMIQ